jgi:hypothetical protein
MGFEPTRGNPNGSADPCLGHSAKVFSARGMANGRMQHDGHRGIRFRRPRWSASAGENQPPGPPACPRRITGLLFSAPVFLSAGSSDLLAFTADRRPPMTAGRTPPDDVRRNGNCNNCSTMAIGSLARGQLAGSSTFGYNSGRRMRGARNCRSYMCQTSRAAGAFSKALARDA